MNIGKQSTINDLRALEHEINDLKALEHEIAEIKALKVTEVDQIESGVIASGAIIDQRATGVYHVSGGAQQVAGNTVHGCMLLHMKSGITGGISAGLAVGWYGEAVIFTNETGYGRGTTRTKILTDRNTITDSNGFIKAA